MTTPGIIRIILMIDIVAMALFALFYLRQRRMSWGAYCWWGLIALLLPVLGPFLVISNRPGEWHPDPFPSASLREKVRSYCAELKSSAFQLNSPKSSHRRRPGRRF